MSLGSFKDDSLFVLGDDSDALRRPREAVPAMIERASLMTADAFEPVIVELPL
jgi:hypothetical protein